MLTKPLLRSSAVTITIVYDKVFPGGSMHVSGINPLPLPGHETPHRKAADRAVTETQVVDGVTTYLTGNAQDVETPTSAGMCLMGGSTEVDGAMKWMVEKSGGGDVVILRADDSDGYNDYIYHDLGGVNSVRTLVIDSVEKADSPYVEQVLKNAEAVFLAGGSQWNYYEYWNGTKVEKALDYLVNEKQVPVGGTSAGCHSMGGIFYSAEEGGITSEEALENPYHEKMTMRDDFLAMPMMKHIITDSHFHARDRMGRSVAFLARSIQDHSPDNPGKPRVIAIDEKAAVTIDAHGTGRVWAGKGNERSGKAYFIEASSAPQGCGPGLPLTFNRDVIQCYRIKGTEEGSGSFVLSHDGSWSGFQGGEGYTVNVTGGKFEEDPY